MKTCSFVVGWNKKMTKKLFGHMSTGGMNEVEVEGCCICILTGPPVLPNGTFNQHLPESASIGQMQHPKGCCVELGNWPIKSPSEPAWVRMIVAHPDLVNPVSQWD